MRAIVQLIEAGKVNPIFNRTHPLDQVPGTIRLWEKGHAHGKIAIIL